MSVGIQLDIDVSRLEQMPDQVRRAAEIALRLTALQFWGDIREESPVRTGRMAGAWDLRQVDPLTWSIGTDVVYAPAVLLGSGVHGPNRFPIWIEPVRAKALRFQIGGNTIFAARVLHPGIEPNPAHTRAMQSTEARLPDFIAQALDQVGLVGEGT